MGITLPIDALNATITTQTDFTYINNIISGATSEGVTFVLIDEKYLLPEMYSALLGEGYKVTKKSDSMGNHTVYLISWGVDN